MLRLAHRVLYGGDPIASADAQKSEAHESTANAAASPTADAEQRATVENARTADDRAWPDGPEPVNPEPPTGVRVVRDETDDGGPLIVESSDPDLKSPKLPVNPFPTERKPEIDPPVKK